MASSGYVLTKICDGVVVCSYYIFELNRIINSKWRCLSCASIAFLERYVRLSHFQKIAMLRGVAKVDGRGAQPPPGGRVRVEAKWAAK